MDAFFPSLAHPTDREALRFGEASLSFAEVARASDAVASMLEPYTRVAVLTPDRTETVLAVTGALLAGVCAVPMNPRSGPAELGHLVRDSSPDAVVVPAGCDLPASLAGLPVVSIDAGALARSTALPAPRDVPDPEAPALVMYTSGTTGPPKGAVLPRRALAFDLDALARAWEWTAADTLVHALPLYHVHGLVLGALGPLRVGSRLVHTAPFDPAAIAAALDDGGTMLFGVPTMYRRLADAARHDPGIARALARTRLLVSGSAGLPLTVHETIAELTGKHIVERYGMTETCITCAVPASAPRPGTVGPPLPGVELRLLDDAGHDLRADDRQTMGEIAVRGPSVFLGYLNRPDATAELVRDGWVRSGDMATRDRDGYLRIAGRRSTDIIKCGGFKIGAGEIESVLLEHPGVDEVAVKGVADEDLGERVAAWVVRREGAAVSGGELSALVAERLSPHKRPRDVFFVDRLPRNTMGKVQKQSLHPPAT
ncbi:MAG: AMP-binding protein [Actinobacteria bacterium]|nr:AMP-binding protein [Actinomycetota bacterium]